MAFRVPRHRPYLWAAAEFQLGLRAIRPETWIEIGAEHALLMRQKHERLDRYRAFYYRASSGSLPAQVELVRRVTTHLLNDHPQYFARDGSQVRSRASGYGLDPNDASADALLRLSCLIEEDFMLLEQIDGRPCITAAANAYSSSGRLVTSVGRDMDWAHDPVPQLNARLGPRINRVIGGVHPNTPCERFNWQLTPIATVFSPAMIRTQQTPPPCKK
jgi:dimethylamine monooxygenase subunit A